MFLYNSFLKSTTATLNIFLAFTKVAMLLVFINNIRYIYFYSNNTNLHLRYILF